MAKYEVIARGIFVKEKGKIRELQLGEVITEPDEHLPPKVFNGYGTQTPQ